MLFGTSVAMNVLRRVDMRWGKKAEQANKTAVVTYFRIHCEWSCEYFLVLSPQTLSIEGKVEGR